MDCHLLKPTHLLSTASAPLLRCCVIHSLYGCLLCAVCCVQARLALATSRLRLARFLRISRLKASMLEDSPDMKPLDDYFSAPGYTSARTASPPAVLGASSSWPNMAGTGPHQAAGTMPTSGSTGSLSAAVLGSGGLGLPARQQVLPGLDTLLPSRSVPVGLSAAGAQVPARVSAPGAATAAQAGSGLPTGSRHARSASDVSAGLWGLQARSVYVMPDPRMQLLSPAVGSAESAAAPPSARSSSTGGAGAPLLHRGSLDTSSRQWSFARGHSRSKSMGYDPALMQLGGLQVGPHVDPTAAVPAGFAAGSGAGGHFGGSQAQQALQQPQHRRLSSWPSRGLVPGQCVVIVDVVVVPTYENVRLQPHLCCS